MKDKKIKNLNNFERLKICDKYVYNNCEKCPFRTDGHFGHICVHQILNVLERKVNKEDFE